MTVAIFLRASDNKEKLCNDNHKTKKVSIYCIYSKHSDAFVVLACPCLLLLIFYLSSRVFTGVKEIKTEGNKKEKGGSSSGGQQGGVWDERGRGGVGRDQVGRDQDGVI